MYTTYERTLGSVLWSQDANMESSIHSNSKPSMSGKYAALSSTPSSIAIAVDVTKLSRYAFPEESTATTATVTGRFGITKASYANTSIVSGNSGFLSKVAIGF